MPRHVEQDVHAAFVEFRAEEGDKCMSVQCVYCQQVRAKNTTRQKQHLQNCAAYLQAHPDVILHDENDAPADGYDTSQLDGQTTGEHTSLGFMPNPRIINGTPTHAGPGRPSLGSTPASKKQKTKHTATGTPGSNMLDLPLREVHAAFVEFRVKEDDKCLSAKCIYCSQVRAKNTSRQREHLMTCPGYQAVLKERIPANNLRHQFDDDDVASSLALPTPTLELDFRISIRVKPKVTVGNANFGKEGWVSCIGGQWAGRWGKGTVLPGGQDSQTTVKDMATRISARYLIQTHDDNPALIICNINGWWTGDKDIMERLQDPVAADNVAASRYLMRVTISLETGDERYASTINTGVWLGSGCRRGAEIVYDAYRVN
ncbi:hypothetical protein B0H63DRAFT_17193 [Podospora didyma]|uniref:Uncharacterized protein n=1 Tax=Podospora didyma TaxID=330526 RepID=A0AAE0P4T0_9PEZI|nr:hypothetical protein B0H63DRAFT_17193 [Podospora didyma]